MYFWFTDENVSLAACRCISWCVITGHMIWNHRDHPRLIRLPTLPRLYCVSWLERLLLVAKRAVHRHGLASAHTPHHTTPWGERASPLPPLPHSLILSVFLSSPIIHSRAKSQSLSPSFSSCLYGSVNPPHPPLDYSPPLSSPFSASLSWGGGGKIHDTCDVSRKSGEQSGTEQSVSLSVCMTHAHWCASERLKYREKKAMASGKGVQWLKRA